MKYKKIDMAHLHLHSTYSELDCISKIPDIVKRAKDYGHTSIALTDHGTIAGVPQFYNECQKQGVKSILASEFYFQPDANKAKEEKNRKNHHLILLAMNQEGWTNIKKLTTKANEKFYYAPRIDYNDLREHSNGLICMTACLKGVVPYAIAEEKYDEAIEHIKKYKDIFGDRFYMELQDGGLDVQIKVNEVMRRMAAKMDVRVVAAQDAHYVNRDDVEGHEGIWAIRTRNTFDDPIGYGPRDDLPEGTKQRPYYSTREYWLKDAHHMLFEDLTTENGAKRLSTLKQSEIEESAAIADRIGDVHIEKRMHLPKYEFIPDISQVGCAAAEECLGEHYHPGDIEDGKVVDLTSFNYLCELVTKGYEKVYQRGWFDRTNEHRERLATELNDIKEAGLADYFLIVWDVVSWAKSQDIPVGPGRGCLTDRSYVFTTSGYKSIKDVKIGDRVINEFGQIVDVLNTASFDIKEKLLEIRPYYDFWSGVQLTKEHKILIKKGAGRSVYKKTLHPSSDKNVWLRSDEVSIGDYICIPKMNYTDHTIKPTYWTLDEDEMSNINGGFLVEQTPINKHFVGSVRHLHRLTGISRNCLKSIVDYGFNNRFPSVISKLEKALKSLDGVPSNISDWITYVKQNRRLESRIPSAIPINTDYAKFMGLWIGDGCYKGNTGISIFLGPNDVDALDFLDKYLVCLGVRYTKYSPKDKDTLIIYDIQSRAINRMFKSIFGNVYSDAKFIPDLFFNSRELKEGLLVGLIWSDGSLSEGRVCFDTTSERLMCDVRKLLLYLETPSSVCKRIYTEEDKCKDSYKIRPARSATIVRLFNINSPIHDFYFEDNKYMYCAIRKISEVNCNGKVYDIAVSGDSPSFLTGGYIVHNSAAGSIVSFCLGITDVDPLKYGLIWERFYNAGRKGSMPDIDVDVGKKFRPLVIDYIRERYGEDRVAQIVTFNTLGTKAALKDTAKILGKQGGMAYEDANVMTRFIPLEHNQPVSISKAIEKSEKMAEYAKKYPRLFDVAKKLEGCPKSRGIHAAGVVISDEPFSTGFPLRWNTKEKKHMTEWDMEVLDSLGYLKMDVLGLKTMDVLHDIEKDVNG